MIDQHSYLVQKNNYMSQILRTNQLNILCMGELTSDRSAFLSFYTSSQSSENYKVFAHRERNIEGSMHQWPNSDSVEKSWTVYLHEIEELDGIDVYLKYPFDAILFFVKIDQFHNTAKNFLETIQLYSRISGMNVYKIPIRIVAVSNKSEKYYDSIGRGDKIRLSVEVSHLINEDQIIFVEFNGKYNEKLSKFYRQIIKGQALGIKESAYTNWHFKGIEDYFACGQLKLSLLKLYGQIRRIIKKRKEETQFGIHKH